MWISFITISCHIWKLKIFWLKSYLVELWWTIYVLPHLKPDNYPICLMQMKISEHHSNLKSICWLPPLYWLTFKLAELCWTLVQNLCDLPHLKMHIIMKMKIGLMVRPGIGWIRWNPCITISLHTHAQLYQFYLFLLCFDFYIKLEFGKKVVFVVHSLLGKR